MGGGWWFLRWAIVTFVSPYFNPLPPARRPPAVWCPVKWNEGSFQRREKRLAECRCTKIDLENVCVLLLLLLLLLGRSRSRLVLNKVSPTWSRDRRSADRDVGSLSDRFFFSFFSLR